MKKIESFRLLLLALMVCSAMRLPAQDFDPENGAGDRLEMLAERRDAAPEDDGYGEELESLKKHPLDLNQASATELYSFRWLTALQISNFILYRKWLGKLLNIYELQAVPGWDPATIRKLLPYIIVSGDESLYAALRERWKEGDASVLLRAGQVLEKSVGFQKTDTPGASRYEGSPQKIFFRYSYNDKQLLQYGLSGEKDAGEPFFRGAQRHGFDFYSFHFFLRHTGIIQELALGDFTVNLGQGLIQWQTTAFSKGGMVLRIKRQAARLRPYRSAGEFNFHRGGGITLKKGPWNSTLFLSLQKISGNADTDTSSREDIFTSFENSGYHRTANEIADRNNNRQFSWGGALGFSKSRLSMNANLIHFRLSKPLLAKNVPYNKYRFKGRILDNLSFDYAYTARNLHFFGELATDYRHFALVQGALLSLSPDVDMAVFYRNISPAYHSLYADAFTENGTPTNERGFYASLSFRPVNGLKIEMYYDLFVFPWLKYRVDAPSFGNEFLIQAVFQPGKKWYLNARFQKIHKGENQETSDAGSHSVVSPVKKHGKLETGYKINRHWRLKSRMDFIWIRKDWTKNGTKQEGFLGFLDVFYNSSLLNANLRVQRFLIPGYDFRTYIYENDMLYNFSLPAYFDNGWRYYINLHKRFHTGKNRATPSRWEWSVWIKWSQTIYSDKPFIGSGLDVISGNRKSEIKAEILLNW